jgi:hypothetical protein
VGDTVSFNVFGVGVGPITYQWLLNGLNLSGATTSNLLLNNVQLTDAGSYNVVLTDQRGSQSSDSAILALKPVISVQPQSQSLGLGANASFTVTATGTGALSYRWRRNGIKIPGQTTATLSLPNVQAADSGNYSVVVSVQTPLGPLNMISSNAMLTVLPAP